MVGFGGPCGEGGRGLDGGPARGPAVPTAPGFVHRRRQTRASGSCQPSALFFFFFKKTTASAVREKPHLPADGNRAVLQLD